MKTHCLAKVRFVALLGLVGIAGLAFPGMAFPAENDASPTITVQIYNYAISPYDEWHAQAWAATLVLMTLVLGINIMVRFLTRRKF